MAKLNTWLMAAGIVAVMAGAQLLDGPSEADIAEAQAADLQDARLAAQRFERDLKACQLAMGPAADLIQIDGTDDYVCREVAVDPTPAEILHRYADLAGRKQ